MIPFHIFCAAENPLVPHPCPFSRGEKGVSTSPSGRGRSEGPGEGKPGLLQAFIVSLVVGTLTIMNSAWGKQNPDLSVEDFTFEGPLGSEGTTIERVEKNHFKVTLGSAPGHPDWNNKLQFTIK